MRRATMALSLVSLSLVSLAACSPAPTASEQSTAPTGGDEGTEPAPAQAEASLPAPMRALLDAHNRRRAEHCAPPLAWSPELAARAQAWAASLRDRSCAFEHSESDYGENLAGGTSGTLDGESVTEMWYAERAHYDFRRGGFSMETGHFTQLVWVASERIGCGFAQCDGMDLWVCNYDSAGNLQDAYRENVLPTSCR